MKQRIELQEQRQVRQERRAKDAETIQRLRSQGPTSAADRRAHRDRNSDGDHAASEGRVSTMKKRGILVNPENFVALFRAFQMIDLDSGAVNRLEPAKTKYLLRLEYFDLVISGSRELDKLSDEAFEDFCIGEQTDAPDTSAHKLLTLYFEGDLTL